METKAKEIWSSFNKSIVLIHTFLSLQETRNCKPEKYRTWKDKFETQYYSRRLKTVGEVVGFPQHYMVV